ncbi:caspase family protein [Streptomyces sp. NPDC048641]|uniref:caspase family protein n=1 Tax=Streptomyces sp. NPDC048641 TaxID=3154825 RepID=UPI0034259669
MGKIHAFLVGVNTYSSTVAAPLRGCLNDVESAGELLAERTAATVPAEIRFARDGEATVEAVEDGIRGFLGAAGPGDTALFWFSGHGTEEQAYGDDLLIESTGRNQALVCVDGPLPDKRLGALLDGVAAGGAHVVAVLDCCFSGGGSRDGELTARFAPPSPEWDLTARDAPAPPGGGRHLLLAASRSDQLSYEGHYDGRRRGVFTHALLAAVRAAGPGATYRQLLAAADARVRRDSGLQQPVLLPATRGGPADLPFLGGTLARDPSPYLLRGGAGGWEVDCGTGHGITAPGAEFTVVDDPAAGGVVRARDVRVDKAFVDPVDWTPQDGQVYPMALSSLPLAPATVRLDTDGWPSAGDLLGAALRTAGPDGGPAPLLRRVVSERDGADLHFAVRARDGQAQVLRRDGTPFVDPLPLTGPGDAGRVVDCLTHLTRWHQLRDLTPRPGVLDNLVQVEIVAWGPPAGEVLLPDGSGEVVCSYERGPEGPREPLVSVRLHNRSPDRPLWCLLLDLTDSYGSHAALFPGHFIAPGHTGHALEGDPVQLSLPPNRPVEPGASVKDWLKLIVAEGELNTVPFEMPAWDPLGASRGTASTDSDVLRFAAPESGGHSREAGRVTGARAPGRWTVRTIGLRTVVPGP